MRTILEKARARVARFAQAETGNIAITFAIALVPLLGFVGAAVDYSRVNSARSSMQAALDSAALMVSKDIGAADLSAAQITERAQTYFKALYTNKDGIVPTVDTLPTVTAVYTPNAGKGSTVRLDVGATVATDFMKFVGTPNMNIKTVSVTNWGSVRLRVALVLDTTGSMGMNTGKIEALKTATTKLLAQLKASASKPEDVYVSIIPFSKNVNANPANYKATWIDWTEWLAEPPILDTSKGGSKPSGWSNVGPGSNCPFTDGARGAHGFTCVDRPATTAGATAAAQIPATGYICPTVDSGYESSLRIGRYYNGCYDSVGTVTNSSSTVSSCSGKSECTCTTGRNATCTQVTHPVVAPYTHTWRPATAPDATPDKSTWNGCVTERGLTSGPSKDYDRSVTAPVTGTTASLFPAEQNSYCSPPVIPMSNDWAAMNTVVNGLYPLGGTNQPIGLVHGWQSLVGGGPFPTPPTKDAGYTYQDIIVLMSDGLNTQDRWYGNGGDPSTDVDNRMYQSSSVGTCPNIWAAGITIYTVHVNTDNSTESALLKNCASTNKDTKLKEFQLVTSASGIGVAFDKIATQLTALRVSQ